MLLVCPAEFQELVHVVTENAALVYISANVPVFRTQMSREGCRSIKGFEEVILYSACFQLLISILGITWARNGRT
jgi:hypothetical protein